MQVKFWGIGVFIVVLSWRMNLPLKLFRIIEVRAVLSMVLRVGTKNVTTLQKIKPAYSAAY